MEFLNLTGDATTLRHWNNDWKSSFVWESPYSVIKNKINLKQISLTIEFTINMEIGQKQK